MKKFVIFPNLIVKPEQKSNPYIQDFIRTLNEEKDACVVNPSHKNPLLSILFPKNWGDIFVFNWFESIPDFKYGILQSIAALFFLPLLVICRKKIVWIFHNKRPHADGREVLKKMLGMLITRLSTLILTHATEGVEVIEKKYPYAAHKVHFVHHPTKNRLPIEYKQQIDYDLLIWGQISKYKGIFDFVRFLQEEQVNEWKVCIIGGASNQIFQELKEIAPACVTLVNHSPSFEELGEYIARSRFVLSPYAPESVLSSGMLMDSLSFGAKVIGPNVGSFRDYAHEPHLKVYTFNSFHDIKSIIAQNKDEEISLSDYRSFLEQHNWTHFIHTLMELLTTGK